MAAPERAASDRGLSDPSIVRVRAVIEAGLATLEARREDVNALNLAGVADGDTGDNMVLTLRAVLEELDRLAGATEGRTIDEIGRGEIVASVARAALLGARGSSGVILSQLIRGAAEELASRPGELIDPVLVGAALARAADQAYGSVREPAEGTMLTVVREMAHRVASELAHGPEARLAPRTTALEQDLAIAAVIDSAMQAGEHPVGHGPDRPRDVGELDAGGYGLVVLMAGIIAALRGAATEVPRRTPELPVRPGAGHTSITYRWCTSFAVTGRRLAARAFRPGLESIGDAVLVVGDESTLKVHLHTDDPEAATAQFAAAGIVSHLEVVDMRPSAVAPAHGPAHAPASGVTSGLVVAVESVGLGELFAGFGARVVDGPDGLAAALAELGTPEAVVVPGGVVALDAAREIAALTRAEVQVVDAQSPQAGLAAAAAWSPAHSAADNTTAMAAAIDRLRTASVAPAAADDPGGRYRAGDALGEVDGELVAWGDPAATLRGVLARLSTGAEVVSCLSGVAPPLGDAAVRALAGESARGVGVTTAPGGQSSSWWLLSAQ